MSTHKGQGQGKVILLGEHAVVYGAPAIAVGLGRGVDVTLRRGSAGIESPLDPRGDEALGAMASSLGLDPKRLSVEIRSQLPPAAGLGSSAALCVALAQALLSTATKAVSTKAVSELATLGETVFHGNPSGLDVTMAVHGGLIRFQRDHPQGAVRAPVVRPLPMVIADTGERCSTREQVESLAALKAQQPQRITGLLARYAELVEQAWPLAKAASWEALGPQLSAGHELLIELGVSSPKLDGGVALAMDAGAWGAKLTGAGGGGCLIALAPEPTQVSDALRDAGFKVLGDA